MRTIERVAAAARFDPEQEEPLFAASPEFAAARGGPVTSAFLATLPPDWLESAIVNSSLVWLTPGLAHDEAFGDGNPGPQRGRPPFRHEPFPAATRGVRARANRNREAVHRCLIVGGPAPEFVTGTIELEDHEDPTAFWLCGGALRERDDRLHAWLEAGAVNLQPAPLGASFEYRWGTFWRPTPALTPGFQFLVRATFGDVCPPIDAVRNAIFL